MIALVAAAAAAGTAAGVPPAPPHVVVADGAIRLSALSPHVLRLERKGPRGFEDYPTFLAQNRSAWASTVVTLGVPIAGSGGTVNVTVGGGSDDAVVVVITDHHRDAESCWTNAGGLSLFPTAVAGPAVHAADAGECCAACDALQNCTSWMFNQHPQQLHQPEPEALEPPSSSCSRLTRATDVTNPRVIRGNESMQCNMSLAECCGACDKNSECRAFVLAAPSSWSVCPHLPYCFILSSYSGTRAKPGTTFGTKANGPSPPQPPPAPFPPAPPEHTNCALNLGYGETHIGGETFGCPRRGCAAAWSGRWQGGDLGRSFRQPPLSLHASVFSVATGELLGSSDHASAPLDFPSPSAIPGVFSVQDSPRFLVPRGGAIPQSHLTDQNLQNTSGYDIRNDADDIYLFIPSGNYTRLKRDFIALTGRVPRLPDWAFGTWFTEWHNYSQVVAEEEMLRWRSEKLPLSVWGLDVNWRNNAFGGNNCTRNAPGITCEYYYNQTNTTRLPNITALFEFEHQHGLRTYLNDHPKGMALETSPYEIGFRYDGLVSMLEKGCDYWWYDPNWHIGIKAPFNLEGHVWGAHVYTSVLTHYYKEAAGRSSSTMTRPFMLGIADASHPAAHRYPVWWTGDDKSLGYSINSMVQLGQRCQTLVESSFDGCWYLLVKTRAQFTRLPCVCGAGVSHLKPYVHSDCGGVADKQTGLVGVPEYVRWSQHCALGAIHRYHGGPGHQPWLYDNETESIVRSFLNLRMNLMPMLLAAGELATQDATPIVRRLDLVFPMADRSNTTRTDQYLLRATVVQLNVVARMISESYLLGDDLLVAPFSSGGANGTATREVWVPPGSWQDAWAGSTIVGPKLVVSTQPLGRIPLWHRKGGVVITAPSAQTVDEQDWSELTLEIFPHALDESDGYAHRAELLQAGPAVDAVDTSERRQRPSEIRRVVREGEAGEGTTVYFQESTDGRLSIDILPSDSTPARAWLLRVNLAPNHALASAVLIDNATAVSLDTVTILAPAQPDHSPEFFPLRGRGEAPASEAGDIVELPLASAVGRRSVALQLAVHRA